MRIGSDRNRKKPLLGIGIVGTGFGRIAHVPAFLAVEGAQLIGVASARPERAREVAAEFSLPRFFSSWQEMIASPQIQAVSITTPPALHQEIATAALEAGKAVLCEKPLALNAAQAERLLQAARRSGKAHLTSFVFREIPAMQQARLLLKSRALGRLRHVKITWLTSGGADPARPWSWRSDKLQGGGVLHARGVHVLDYVEWLAGPIRSLAAHLSVRIASRPDSDGRQRAVTGPDCCQLLMELHDETPVILTLSSVAPADGGHWIEFFGEKKTMRVGTGDPRDYEKGFSVWIGEPGSKRLRRFPVPAPLRFERTFRTSGVAPLRMLAQRLVDAAQGKIRNPRPSFEDGFRAQLLIDSAFQSMEKNQCWIDVPDPVPASVP